MTEKARAKINKMLLSSQGNDMSGDSVRLVHLLAVQLEAQQRRHARIGGDSAKYRQVEDRITQMWARLRLASRGRAILDPRVASYVSRSLCLGLLSCLFRCGCIGRNLPDALMCLRTLLNFQTELRSRPSSHGLCVCWNLTHLNIS